jgi:hypothetical protein
MIWFPKILSQNVVNTSLTTVYTVPAGKTVVCDLHYVNNDISSTKKFEKEGVLIYIVKSGDTPWPKNIFVNYSEIQNSQKKTDSNIFLYEWDSVIGLSYFGKISVHVLGIEYDISSIQNNVNSSNQSVSVNNAIIAHSNKVVSCPCPS